MSIPRGQQVAIATVTVMLLKLHGIAAKVAISREPFSEFCDRWPERPSAICPREVRASDWKQLRVLGLRWFCTPMIPRLQNEGDITKYCKQAKYVN
ncbi:MAG TPA: hypothetical protein V6D20_12515 [Candidatus Obscuribacterales bacterium]